MNATAAIKLNDVTVSINGLVVLDRISLVIDRGEFTAVIGPNGAGQDHSLETHTWAPEARLGQRGGLRQAGRPARG